MRRQREGNAEEEEEPSSPTTTTRTDLPVIKARTAITSLIRKNRAVILVGETGSGKTTQVPQFVLDDIVERDRVRAIKNRSGRGDAGAATQTKAHNDDHDDDDLGDDNIDQHPQPLLVGVTQPRRVAATSVAEYVAKCRNVACGDEVGYCVRFDEKTSAKTRLKFMTDGMLLRELLVDPALSRYACIILDEAHERTLNGDVLFGLLKRLFVRRKDLRIIVMSATLDSDSFSRFWNNAPVGFVSGRAFPVSLHYAAEPQADYVDASIVTILQIHLTEKLPGDILCFLTGQDEIEDAKRSLEERIKYLPPNAPSYKIVTLYAAMSPAQQMEAFRPAPDKSTRKIILATNIAETSITIEGVVYVVDCGLVKARNFHASSGLETLQVCVGSKAQARQRAGRAGRVCPGKCYRLFQEDAFERIPDQTVPEILRCNLSTVVLQMKKLNIDDVVGFDFMDRPSDALLLKALEELVVLKAIDEETGKITTLGKNLVKFPVEPMEAKCILKAMELGVSDEVCVILAMMAVSEHGLFEGASVGGSSSKSQADRARSAFNKSLGDHLSLLAVYEAYSKSCGGGSSLSSSSSSSSTSQQRRAQWCQQSGVNPKQMRKAVDIEVQLRSHCAKMLTNSPSSASDHQRTPKVAPYIPGAILQQEAASEYQNIRKSFVSGFFMHAGFFDVRDRQYKTAVGKNVVFVHPTSVIFNLKKKPPLVLFHVVVQTSRSYMREILQIREEWLYEEAPMVFARPTSSNV